MSLDPRTKKLHQAVATYTDKTGINAAALGALTEKIIGLIAARWEHICDSAADEENKGKISLALGINLDMTRKCPIGAVRLRFVPKRVNDEAGFETQDPDQATLPLGSDASEALNQAAEMNARRDAAARELIARGNSDPLRVLRAEPTPMPSERRPRRPRAMRPNTVSPA